MSGRVPPSSRAKSRKPISARDDVLKAGKLFERFTGHEAEIMGRVTVPPLPRVMAAIGVVDFIGYTTVRDGVKEKYIHNFKAADRPVMAVSPDGRSIYLIGDRYRFTERGIVDMSDKSR